MAKWVRKGECNHCGYCCLFSVHRVQLFSVSPTAKDAEYLKVRGFVPLTRDGKEGLAATGNVYLPCPMHIMNRCSMYHRRPVVCQEFPVRPEQIVRTPCSYWFEDAEGRNMSIGGDASPYPLLQQNFELVKDMHESGLLESSKSDIPLVSEVEPTNG